MPDSLQPTVNQPKTHLVEVATGAGIVQLPNGFAYTPGKVATLTDDEFNAIPASAFSSGKLLRRGQVTQFGSGGLKIHRVPLVLATLTASNVVSFKPGFAGSIRSIAAIVKVPVTTAAKLATITPRVNSTSVTGGALALTSANMTPKGAIVAGAAITAANTFTANDTVHLTASAITAFVEGEAEILLVLV